MKAVVSEINLTFMYWARTLPDNNIIIGIHNRLITNVQHEICITLLCQMSVAGGDDEDVCACQWGKFCYSTWLKICLHGLYSSFDLTIEHNMISLTNPRHLFYNQIYIAHLTLDCEIWFVFLWSTLCMWNQTIHYLVTALVECDICLL